MMPDMGKHAVNDRALRRARAAAWTVFLSMAGTTMTFQVFHSIKVGRMPWPLAVLYGVVPLLISICILEIVAEWAGSPWWAKAGAYLIMGGSMFMSASATGEVVLHAAPPHWSLLFGFLLDGAALLAVHFLLSGPRAAVALPAGLPAAPAAAPVMAPAAALPGAMGEAAGKAMPEATGEPSQEPPADAIREPAQKPRRSAMRGPSNEPDAVKARAAYRKSQRDGNLLSDRALGDMFGKSRTWGANRIKECEAGPHLASKAV